MAAHAYRGPVFKSGYRGLRLEPVRDAGLGVELVDVFLHAGVRLVAFRRMRPADLGKGMLRDHLVLLRDSTPISAAFSTTRLDEFAAFGRPQCRHLLSPKNAA